MTDKPLFDMGYADKVTRVLDGINIQHQVFYHVTPDPTFACVEAGLKEMEEFKPDVIIALGGGSPMDAAKVMWLMYEVPGTKFDGLAMRFMDIRKRVYELPQVCVAVHQRYTISTTCLSPAGAPTVVSRPMETRVCTW